MRKFHLNKVPGVESTVVDAPVETPEQETLEVLEPVVVKVPGEEECEELDSGCEELDETCAALESLAIQLEASTRRGGMTAGEIQLVQAHAKFLTKRIGLDNVTVSSESAHTRIEHTQVALEGITDALKSAGKALLDFLKRLWDAAVTFFTGLPKHARELKAKFKALKGKDVDVNREVLSGMGHKGIFLTHGGKPNRNLTTDLTKYLDVMFSCTFEASKVPGAVISKMKNGSLTGSDMVVAMIESFPVYDFAKSLPANSTNSELLEGTWVSPLEASTIEAVVPKPGADVNAFDFRDIGKLRYKHVVADTSAELSGSLADIGMHASDTLIDVCIELVDKLEKASSELERELRHTRAMTSIYDAVIKSNVPEGQARSFMVPFVRAVTDPMRPMGGVVYQVLLGIEHALSKAAGAAPAEKEVNSKSNQLVKA